MSNTNTAVAVAVDVTAIKSAFAAVKDAYLAEHAARAELETAADARAEAVTALADLLKGAPLQVDGHQLTCVVGGGKGRDAAFVRGLADMLGIARTPATKSAKVRNVVSI